MKRICARCGKVLGMLGSELDAQDVITQGLCKDCRRHLFAQMGVPLAVLLRIDAADNHELQGV